MYHLVKMYQLQNLRRIESETKSNLLTLSRAAYSYVTPQTSESDQGNVHFTITRSPEVVKILKQS